MKALNDIFNNFGFATLIDVHIYKLVEGKKYGQILNKSDFDQENAIVLDTLKICNIKEKGAKHTFKAGGFNMPIRRIGNTITMEIKDALGKWDTLQTFFNFKQTGARLYKNLTFTTPFALEGRTTIVDVCGNLNDIYIFIPCFLPSGALEINTTMEQDFGVFDLSGEIYPIFFDSYNPHIEWYSLSPYSIFDPRSSDNIIFNQNIVHIKHSFGEPTQLGTDSIIYDKDIVEMIPALNNELPFVSDNETVTMQQTYNAENNYYNSFVMDGDQVIIDLNEDTTD